MPVDLCPLGKEKKQEAPFVREGFTISTIINIRNTIIINMFRKFVDWAVFTPRMREVTEEERVILIGLEDKDLQEKFQ